jgi:hypothetical protein
MKTIAAVQALLKDMNLKIWAYELVDELLTRIDSEGSGRIRFSIHTAAGKQAIAILKAEMLVKFSSPFLLGAVLSITEKGKDVLAIGGIEKYFEFWNHQKSNTQRQ